MLQAEVGLSWGLSWLHVGRLLELKLRPKLDLSWDLSWPHVGGLGACWGILRRCLDDLKAMLPHVKASSPPAKRAASEPVSKNPRACAFTMFTTNAFNICFQIACTMLVTLVPLDWFACLLFVFFSERFPFICRAGLCWTPFLCTGTVFGAPRAEN